MSRASRLNLRSFLRDIDGTLLQFLRSKFDVRLYVADTAMDRKIYNRWKAANILFLVHYTKLLRKPRESRVSVEISRDHPDCGFCSLHSFITDREIKVKFCIIREEAKHTRSLTEIESRHNLHPDVLEYICNRALNTMAFKG